MKAGKGLANCVRAVGWAFFGAIVVMACLGCGGETENISTAQPVTEPAESGQTETLTTGHEGAAPDSSSGCSLPADFDTFPQEKQALEREWQAECEAAQAGYHAPKPTNQSPDLSCPLDLHVETGIAPLTFQPFPAGPFFPVLINRGSDNRFFALSTQCTHAGCVVPPFSTTTNAIVCPCHGSRYALDGSLISGATPGVPQNPLTQYPVTSDGADVLCVEIPNLGYVVTGSTVQSGGGPRFRLAFPTRLNVKYELLFRQSLSDAGSVVGFSTTEGGAATTTVLTGNNQIRTIYVDRTTAAGFYTVSVQVTSG